MQGLAPLFGIPFDWMEFIQKVKTIRNFGPKADEDRRVRDTVAYIGDRNRSRPSHEHLTCNTKKLHRMRRIAAGGPKAIAKSGVWRARIERLIGAAS